MSILRTLISAKQLDSPLRIFKSLCDPGFSHLILKGDELELLFQEANFKNRSLPFCSLLSTKSCLFVCIWFITFKLFAVSQFFNTLSYFQRNTLWCFIIFFCNLYSCIFFIEWIKSKIHLKDFTVFWFEKRINSQM